MTVPNPECQRVAFDGSRWLCSCGAQADHPAPSRRAAQREWNLHRFGGAPPPRRPSNEEILRAAREADAEGKQARAAGLRWIDNPYRVATTDRLVRVQAAAWAAGWDAGA